MASKVLLLAKPYPLSFHLEQCIRESGCSLMTVYEQPRSAYRYARSMARSIGLLKTSDILAYSLYERIFRRREIQECMKQFPSAPHAPAGISGMRGNPSQLPETIFANSANSEFARSVIGEFQPDVMVVHATRILRAETFRLAKVAVNLHVGVLPNYRGHDSTFWALHNGDTENVGATLHVIDSGADTGKILWTMRVTVEPEDTDVTAWIKAFRAGTELVLRFLSAVEPVSAAEPNGGEGSVEAPAVFGAKASKHWPRRGISDYLFARMRHRQTGAQLRQMPASIAPTLPAGAQSSPPATPQS